MHIYVSQTLAHKVILVDKVQHFFMFRKVRRRERGKKRQYLRPVLEVSAGEFADDEGMADNLSIIQQCFKSDLSVSKVLYPH